MGAVLCSVHGAVRFCIRCEATATGAVLPAGIAWSWSMPARLVWIVCMLTDTHLSWLLRIGSPKPESVYVCSFHCTMQLLLTGIAGDTQSILVPVSHVGRLCSALHEV